MKSNGRILIATGGFFLLWALLTGATIAWRLVFLWVSLRILLHLLLRYGSENLTCSLELRTRNGSSQGEFEIAYVFVNNGLLPIPWCQVKVHLERELGSYEFEPETVGFFAGEIKTIRKQFCCPRRGIYEVGGATVIFKDLLGIHHREILFQKHVAVEVFPRRYPIETVMNSGLKEGGHIRGSWPSEQDYTSISRIRPAYSQESSRHIHWKASARTDDVLIREYETRKRPGVLVLLDSGEEKYALDSDGSVEDRCVEVAAGIVSHWLGKGYEVSLMLGHEKVIHLSGITSLDRALRALMVYRPHEESSATGLFQHLPVKNLQESLLLVISPQLSRTEVLTLGRMQSLRTMLFAVGSEPDIALGHIQAIRIPA